MTTELRAWSGREAGTLALLVSVFVSANLDKALMGILIEPLKSEFALSDAQLGLLAGLAFSSAFTAAAIPFGRLADRTNRRNLLVAALVLWSLATLLCGWAASLAQLLILRALIGAGEAAGLPAVQSMIADIFPHGRRGTAMSIYYLGLPIAGFLTYTTGPWLVSVFGWRAAPTAFGAAGIVIALLLAATLKEPARDGSADGRSAPVASLTELVRFARGQRALLHLSAAIVINTFVTSGIGIWIMSFFVRAHGLSLLRAGVLVAVMQSVPKLVGTFAGGILSDRFGKRDERLRLHVVAVATLLTTPMVCGLAMAPSLPMAMVFVGLYGFLISFWYGPAYATVQGLLGNRMRATYLAGLLVLTNILGLGLGPQLVGLISDAFGSSAEPRSLAYAFLILALFLPWAAFHFHRAGRHLVRDRLRVDKPRNELGAD